MSSTNQSQTNDYGLVAGCTLAILLCLAVFINLIPTRYQQFSYLSLGFGKGQLFFTNQIPFIDLLDSALVHGHYYWAEGPLPSVILVPFTALAEHFGTFFYQGYLQALLTIGVAWCCYWLARRFRYSIGDAAWLALAFCFASVYHFIAFVSWSWYYAQAVTVFLSFLGLVEYFGRRRYWLIGLLLAATMMSRVTAALGVLFYLGDIMTTVTLTWRKKLRASLSLLLPLFIGGLLLLGYNYVRFQNPLENGYRLVNNFYWSMPDQRYELDHRGLFQLANIPTNFYYYFIKTLDPVVLNYPARNNEHYLLQAPYLKVGYPGVGFFVVAPIFLYLFRRRYRERQDKLLLATCGLTLLALLTYYTTGWFQSGPRYLLDLLPYAFVLLLGAWPEHKLTNFSRGLIVASALFNVFLLTTML